MTATPDLSHPAKLSNVDLIRYLTLQALRLPKAESTEKTLALSCARFQTACSESEWFQVLESVLGDLGHYVYIIIDLQVLESCPVAGFDWASAILGFFERLAERSSNTKVKVLLLKYGPENLPQTEKVSDFIISMRGPVRNQPRSLGYRRGGFATRQRLLHLN
jgi:hypothetical protein